jgi:Flp pilus assembly pilin Flp
MQIAGPKAKRREQEMDLVTGKIRLALRAWLTDEEGQDLVEYAMIAALLSLGAVAGIGQVGSAVAGVFDKLAAILLASFQ